MAAPGDIILGHGVFSIGGTDIALTRGGGMFAIEREYREIEADGDRGPVKGRIVIDTSRARLTMNVLEIIPENVPKLYPAMKHESAGGTDTITGTLEVVDTDYQTVTWTGRTKGGRAVIITLNNAICLENPEWPLEDKNEVVAQVIYTATYTEDARDVEPWKIEWVEGDVSV